MYKIPIDLSFKFQTRGFPDIKYFQIWVLSIWIPNVQNKICSYISKTVFFVFLIKLESRVVYVAAQFTSLQLTFLFPFDFWWTNNVEGLVTTEQICLWESWKRFPAGTETRKT